MRPINVRTICWLLAAPAVFSAASVGAFSNPSPQLTKQRTHRRCAAPLGAVASEWQALVESNDIDGASTPPVIKRILQPADSDSETPQPGSTVAIAYSGSLWMDTSDDENFGRGCGIASWDTETVLDCWLKEQQGLFEPLQGLFAEHSVDGAMLLDEELFTEEFVSNTLGVSNKIQCKKTIMAARRLRITVADSSHAQVFDSKSAEAPYTFVLGTGKTIRAMELLVASMAVGETSEVVARCDYGYGADGFRTSKGDVLVPPFCGLSFQVTLLSVDQE